VNILGLLIAALLLPAHARAQPQISSCAAMILPASASRGVLDESSREALERFVDIASMKRDPRYRMAIYAPETRCRTDLCAAGRTQRREATIRRFLVGRGIAADRIRLIGLDEGLPRFGRVPEGAALILVQSPESPKPSCATRQLRRR
jgi:hypothetical protein